VITTLADHDIICGLEDFQEDTAQSDTFWISSFFATVLSTVNEEGGKEGSHHGNASHVGLKWVLICQEEERAWWMD